MATWNADKPALADTIAADVPDIEENFQELHDVIEHLTDGTLGTTEPAAFNLMPAKKYGYRMISAAGSLDTTADWSGTWTTWQVDTNAVGFGCGLVAAADGHLDEADADAAGTMPCIGAALETGVGAKKVLLHGFIRDNDWTWTVGASLYVSTTQGTFTETKPSGSGDQVQAIGVAIHADIIYFNPSLEVTAIA